MNGEINVPSLDVLGIDIGDLIYGFSPLGGEIQREVQTAIQAFDNLGSAISENLNKIQPIAREISRLSREITILGKQYKLSGKEIANFNQNLGAIQESFLRGEKTITELNNDINNLISSFERVSFDKGTTVIEGLRESLEVGDIESAKRGIRELIDLFPDLEKSLNIEGIYREFDRLGNIYKKLEERADLVNIYQRILEEAQKTGDTRRISHYSQALSRETQLLQQALREREDLINSFTQNLIENISSIDIAAPLDKVGNKIRELGNQDGLLKQQRYAQALQTVLLGLGRNLDRLTAGFQKIGRAILQIGMLGQVAGFGFMSLMFVQMSAVQIPIMEAQSKMLDLQNATARQQQEIQLVNVALSQTQQIVGMILMPVIEISDQFKMAEIIVKNITGTFSGARNVIAELYAEAVNLPGTFQDLTEILSSMTLSPSIRSQISDFDELKRIIKESYMLVQQMATINPAQGVQGALIAIQELLGGQTRSLQMRFNIDLGQVEKAVGQSFSKIKGDAIKTIEFLKKFFNNLVPVENIMERTKTFSGLMEKISDISSAVFANISKQAYETFMTRMSDLLNFDLISAVLTNNLQTIDEIAKNSFNPEEIYKRAERLKQVFTNISNDISMAMNKLWYTIQRVINNISNALNKITNIGIKIDLSDIEKLTNPFEKFVAVVGKSIEFAIKLLDKFLNSLAGTQESANKLIKGLADSIDFVVKAISNVKPEIFAQMINGFAELGYVMSNMQIIGNNLSKAINEIMESVMKLSLVSALVMGISSIMLALGQAIEISAIMFIFFNKVIGLTSSLLRKVAVSETIAAFATTKLGKAIRFISSEFRFWLFVILAVVAGLMWLISKALNVDWIEKMKSALISLADFTGEIMNRMIKSDIVNEITDSLTKNIKLDNIIPSGLKELKLKASIDKNPLIQQLEEIKAKIIAKVQLTTEIQSTVAEGYVGIINIINKELLEEIKVRNKLEYALKTTSKLYDESISKIRNLTQSLKNFASAGIGETRFLALGEAIKTYMARISGVILSGINLPQFENINPLSRTGKNVLQSLEAIKDFSKEFNNLRDNLAVAEAGIIVLSSQTENLYNALNTLNQAELQNLGITQEKINIIRELSAESENQKNRMISIITTMRGKLDEMQRYINQIFINQILASIKSLGLGKRGAALVQLKFATENMAKEFDILGLREEYKNLKNNELTKNLKSLGDKISKISDVIGLKTLQTKIENLTKKIDAAFKSKELEIREKLNETIQKNTDTISTLNSTLRTNNDRLVDLRNSIDNMIKTQEELKRKKEENINAQANIKEITENIAEKYGKVSFVKWKQPAKFLFWEFTTPMVEAVVNKEEIQRGIIEGFKMSGVDNLVKMNQHLEKFTKLDIVQKFLQTVKTKGGLDENTIKYAIFAYERIAQGKNVELERILRNIPDKIKEPFKEYVEELRKLKLESEKVNKVYRLNPVTVATEGVKNKINVNTSEIDNALMKTREEALQYVNVLIDMARANALTRQEAEKFLDKFKTIEFRLKAAGIGTDNLSNKIKKLEENIKKLPGQEERRNKGIEGFGKVLNNQITTLSSHLENVFNSFQTFLPKNLGGFLTFKFEFQETGKINPFEEIYKSADLAINRTDVLITKVKNLISERKGNIDILESNLNLLESIKERYQMIKEYASMLKEPFNAILEIKNKITEKGLEIIKPEDVVNAYMFEEAINSILEPFQRLISMTTNISQINELINTLRENIQSLPKEQQVEIKTRISRIIEEEIERKLSLYLKNNFPEALNLLNELTDLSMHPIYIDAVVKAKAMDRIKAFEEKMTRILSKAMEFDIRFKNWEDFKRDYQLLEQIIGKYKAQIIAIKIKYEVGKEQLLRGMNYVQAAALEGFEKAFKETIMGLGPRVFNALKQHLLTGKDIDQSRIGAEQALDIVFGFVNTFYQKAMETFTQDLLGNIFNQMRGGGAPPLVTTMSQSNAQKVERNVNPSKSVENIQTMGEAAKQTATNLNKTAQASANANQSVGQLALTGGMAALSIGMMGLSLVQAGRQTGNTLLQVVGYLYMFISTLILVMTLMKIKAMTPFIATGGVFQGGITLFAGGSTRPLTVPIDKLGGMTAGGTLLGGPTKAFNPYPNTINLYAGGGTLVKKPTPALIGEAGYPEAVVPLKGGAIPVKMITPPMPRKTDISIITTGGESTTKTGGITIINVTDRDELKDIQKESYIEDSELILNTVSYESDRNKDMNYIRGL